MKRALLLTIRLYQRLLSPLLPPACRYVPTCSEYAHEAVEIHGPAKGAMLASWRLLRCHPFSRGGYDPVPPDATHAHVAHDRVAEAQVAEFPVAAARVAKARVVKAHGAHAPSRVRVEAPGGSCRVAHAPSRVRVEAPGGSCRMAHAPSRVRVEAPGFSPADTHVHSHGLQPWA